MIFQQGYFVISIYNQQFISHSAGTLFTFGAGPSNSTIIEAGVSIDTNSTGATNASSSATTGSRSATTTTVAPTKTSNVPAVKSKSRPSLCQKATGWFKLVVKPSRTKISLYFLLPNPLRSFIHSCCSVASTAGGLTLMLYSSGDLFISIFFKLGPCHMLTAVPPPSFSTGSLFTFGPSSLKTTEASISIDANSTGAPNANRSAANGGGVTTTVHPVKSKSQRQRREFALANHCRPSSVLTSASAPQPQSSKPPPPSRFPSPCRAPTHEAGPALADNRFAWREWGRELS